MKILKPGPGEYAPSMKGYVDIAPGDGDVMRHLHEGLATYQTLIRSLPPDKLMYRYAPGKWTIKEILVHLTDAERIFSYRGLRIARTDTTPLAPFEQDQYVPASRANDRSIEDIMEEFGSVRAASIALYRSFDEEAWNRKGTASGHPLSVRATVYQVIGHPLHHLKVLRERYL